MNAVEAMSEVGEGLRELVVGATAEANGVRVDVRDSGPGQTQGDFTRVFEPFYTTKASGLGIGLSICRSIVEAHGGRLWAIPNEPRGALFRMILPIGGDSLERQESSEV